MWDRTARVPQRSQGVPWVKPLARSRRIARARAELDVIGIFELRFDYETGHLREIHIVKSTGSPMLDRYTIASLKHWKAKPRALNAVLYPVEFMGRPRP